MARDQTEGIKILLIDDDSEDDKCSGTANMPVPDNTKPLAEKRFSNADDIWPIPSLQTRPTASTTYSPS